MLLFLRNSRWFKNIWTQYSPERFTRFLYILDGRAWHSATFDFISHSGLTSLAALAVRFDSPNKVKPGDKLVLKELCCTNQILHGLTWQQAACSKGEIATCSFKTCDYDELLKSNIKGPDNYYLPIPSEVCESKLETKIISLLI